MLKDFYELHLQFQNFMISKGYKPRERENLLSPIFPTTFTMSGGPDLAYKFWQGDQSLSGNHIVNQPCIRHWDIEQVGDRKHLSFFNMFVASSMGGYSRKDVVSDVYEFFAGCLQLNTARIYASYFSGGNIKGTDFASDSEMKDIWQALGILSSHIIPMGNIETFVTNTIEPVGGPRAELFYDLRPEAKPINSEEEFLELERRGEILEFFTHVLYNVEVKTEQTGEEIVFNFRKMGAEAIAAGFGPQRILTILEGVGNVKNISILNSLSRCLGELPSGFDREIGIVTDHVRGLVFLIHDGVLDLKGAKTNSRRYLFRKYFKNFQTNFDKLPLENRPAVLADLVYEAVALFSILFPDFVKKRELIAKRMLELYAKYEEQTLKQVAIV